MADVDGLVAAFSEYAAQTWGEPEWRELGRATGTADILNSHPRLYRSISFGDDDYPHAVWSVVPQVLREGAGEPIQEKMQFVADFVPDLVQWIAENGTLRTRKRFKRTLEYAKNQFPPEWTHEAGAMVGAPASSVPAARGIPLPVRPRPAWETESSLKESLPDEVVAADHVDSVVSVAPVSASAPREAPVAESPSRIFIVHGHDQAAVYEVKVRVHELTGLMPEILADQPGRGDTIIEKFEKHAEESDFAIVLLTPDDEGRIAGSESKPQPRARQNVILELGYFLGKLGRKNVAVLNKSVEQPSDINGVNYIDLGSTLWLEELRRELRAAGFILRT